MKLLTAAEKSFYEENGYILLNNIFTGAEIEEISEEYDAVFERKSRENSNMKALWSGDWKQKLLDESERGKMHVLSIHNLQMHSAVFTRLLLHDRLLDAVEDVIDSSNIVLHHTKAHLKPPGLGTPFPMHQDYHYFPFKHHSMVAVFVHLDDADPHNGGLAVYPGSHKLGPLMDHGGEGGHYVDMDRFSLAGAVPVTARKGDVLIFSYFLVHGSYVNRSARPRRMFLAQLHSSTDEALAPIRVAPATGLVLRGDNPNASADLAKRNQTYHSSQEANKGDVN